MIEYSQYHLSNLALTSSIIFKLSSLLYIGLVFGISYEILSDSKVYSVINA